MSTASSSSEEHCCTLVNTSITVALFLLYCCFFMTINLHDVTTAHGNDCCYGDQKICTGLLPRGACAGAHDRSWACVCICACCRVHLCTRLIFNCYLQSAYWEQSVIREAQHEVNSWDSFTSVLMDFLCLCLSLLPPLSLHIAATSTTMNQTTLQSRLAAICV